MYNLLDESWIPMLYADGRFERVGIRTALADAGKIRQIAASNPMDRVALLRFLMAIIYWCRGNPPAQEEKNRLLAAGQFPSGWFSRLEEQKTCFDLLGRENRFYQDRKYADHEAAHTINYLIQEVPSGTNKWHFRHSTDMVDGLCRPCCAQGLIRLPAFATSAGKGMSPATGKSPGINSKPPLYVLPVGKSLFTTLFLLWQACKGELGSPGWIDAGHGLPANGEVPFLTGLTWLPRSIWLADPEKEESVCISCGRMDRLIRRCVFDGKGSIKSEGRYWRDPHVIYQASAQDKPLQTSNALGSTDSAAGDWALQLADILATRAAIEPSRLLVVGFSTVQNDKYLEASDWRIPEGTGSKNGLELAANLKRWGKSVEKLTRRARPRGSKRKHGEVRAAIDSIVPQVETRIAQRIGDSFANEAWDQAAAEYIPMMRTVGKSLFPGFTTRAVQQRTEIAQAVPDPRRNPPKTRKSDIKQGAGQ